MTDEKNYKDTLNLPKTGFPMKGNLANREPAMLKYKCDLQKTMGGEVYVASFSSVNPNGKEQRLLEVESEYDPSVGVFFGKMRVNVSDKQLIPFVLGKPLPDFTAEGDVDYQFDFESQTVMLRGQLDLDARHLERLHPDLVAVGNVDLNAQFAVEGSQDNLAVEKLNVFLKDITGVSLVALKNNQPFHVFLEEGTPRFQSAGNDLLTIELTQLPMRWLQPLMPGFYLNADEFAGAFQLMLKEDGSGGVALKPLRPIEIKNFSLIQGEQPVLSEIDLTLNPWINIAGSELSLDIANIDLRSAGRGALTGSASALVDFSNGLQMSHAQGSFAIDLPALFRQPAFRSMDHLRTGKMKVRVEADLTEDQKLVVETQLDKLSARHRDEILPSVTATLDARRKDDGSLTARIPVEIKGAQGVSKLIVNGVASAGKTLTTFEVNLSAETLVGDDLQMLMAAFTPPEKKDQTKPFESKKSVADTVTAAGTRPDPVADAKPFWSGYAGEVGLEIGRIRYHGNDVLEQIHGQLVMHSDRLAIDKFQAALAGDAITAKGEITFSKKKRERPYELKAEVQLPGFDLGEYLKRANSEAVPLAEGIIDILGEVQGQGRSLAALMETWQGRFSVKGRDGIFRPLSGSEKARRTQAVLGLASLFAGGKVRELQAVNQILEQLKEIHFSKLDIEAERGGNLDIVFKQLALISPELRLNGKGTIRYQQGVPITDQWLELPISLSAKPPVANMLQQLNLLSDKQDDMGYYMGPSFRLSGSLADPANNLDDIIRKAASQVFFGKPGSAELPQTQPQDGQDETAAEPVEPQQNLREQAPREPSDLEKGLNLLNSILNQ